MTPFVQATTNNYWFQKHPEKIAGKEYEDTSRFFPIKVKGTKEDVYRVTKVKPKELRVKIALAKAKAIQIRLKLKYL